MWYALAPTYFREAGGFPAAAGGPAPHAAAGARRTAATPATREGTALMTVVLMGLRIALASRSRRGCRCGRVPRQLPVAPSRGVGAWPAATERPHDCSIRLPIACPAEAGRAPASPG